MYSEQNGDMTSQWLVLPPGRVDALEKNLLLFSALGVSLRCLVECNALMLGSYTVKGVLALFPSTEN